MNDRIVGDLKIFGFHFRRLTLVRIAGAAFILGGVMQLAETFFATESVVWWKLVLGAAQVAIGIMLLVARAADMKNR